MTAVSVAREVIRTFMYLLHKRRVGIHKPPFSQYACYLTNNLWWLQHVLQHRLDYHGVNRTIPQGNRVPVGDELDMRARVDIKRQNIDGGTVVKRFESGADRAAAHDQHSRFL